MAIRLKRSSTYLLYFCTFTCYHWLRLIEKVNGYDLVYKWFHYLRAKKLGDTVAYVIMPNHVHFILFFPSENYDLSKVIGNAKRFMAYEIVKRLKAYNETGILRKLERAVPEQRKDQNHMVFETSFDAKPIYSEPFFFQKLEYIHLNPVNKNWQLVPDYTDYEHSSASFYELNVVRHFEPLHYMDIGY